MNAIAAYIRELRKAQGMSQEDLAHAIGLSPRQYIRAETGRNAMKADALVRAMHVLHASSDHILYLLATPDVTPEEGCRLAQEWLLHRGQSSTSVLPEEIETLAHELAGDPLRLRQWIGYGVRLLDEREQAVSVGGRGEG